MDKIILKVEYLRCCGNDWTNAWLEYHRISETCCCAFEATVVIKVVLYVAEDILLISTLISTIESPDDQLFMIQLYEEHEQLMYWAASKYLTNIEDRRDAVQDAIVTLINNLVTIRKLSENHLRTYVVCTVESKSINLVKRKNIELRLFDDLDNAPAGTPIDFIDEKLFQISMRNTIALIWPKLSMQDKLVLEGKYILGYNDNELGKMLGCKASSVRMYLTRARRKAVELILEVGEFEPS